MAMPRMLRELQQDPTSGYLGAESWFGNPTILLQYWRSFEHLERYAKDPDREHRPAWAAFNRAIASRGDVGIGMKHTAFMREISNAFITTCLLSAWEKQRASYLRGVISILRQDE